MTFSVKLNYLQSLEFQRSITDQDIEELHALYNSEIIGLKHSIRNSPKDFIKNVDIVKSSTVSLINEIIPFSDHFTKKVHSIHQEIERITDGRRSVSDADSKKIETKKRERLYTMEVAELTDAALSILFELLLENFPDAKNNEQIRKIAKDILPREKQFLIEVIDSKKQQGANQQQLLLRDVMIDKSRYHTLMNYLVDEQLCDKDTLIWKDHSPGFKTALASIIQGLHSKGYTRKISADECVLIAQNTFKVSIGQRTAFGQKDHQSLKKIPPAE